MNNVGDESGKFKYRCEHCNRSFNTCVPTYMLMARIADLSDQMFVNFYRGQAETIMGNRTADQIMKLKEDGENILLQEAFNESLFKFFQFTIKATSRVFNDE